MTPTIHSGLVVTQGDPQGIGPELLVQLAAQGAFRAADLIVADPERLRALGRDLPASWASAGWAALEPLLHPDVRPGMGQYAALELGVDAVMAAAGRALVTAPIDKAAARAEGLAYTGHTEYLAARAGGVPVAMLMVGPRLRVVLATIHIPLREVPVQLDVAAVCRAGRLLADGLRRHFGVAAPRVGVLGLNPHAGERGLLGDEELRVIAPAMEALRAEHPESSFEGPLPADTAFFAHGQGRYDGLVAMYHDQGLAPFKLVHFQDGVNMTLGLPYVRTSPDHGTAKDIAGQAVADPSSFAAAVRLARGEARR